MESRIQEAIRYLGYGRNAVDQETLDMVSEAFLQLDQCAKKRSVCRIFQLEQMADDRFKIGKLDVKSKGLGKNLKGCSSVAVFGATLGIEVDRLIQRSSVRNMAKAVVVQACAAAYLEEYCDQIQEELSREKEKEALYLRPRFSPGYGDFSIEYQRPIVQMLDAAKKIGLTLTDSCMMVPSKSVTAVIGISETSLPCHRQGCEICTKTDCLYRRNTA